MILTVAYLLAGLAAGLFGGLTLRWTAAQLRPGAHPASLALVAGGAILRLALAAALLAAALQNDLACGLAAFAGLWAGKWGVIQWQARAGHRPTGHTRS
jgi:hypothetical protein